LGALNGEPMCEISDPYGGSAETYRTCFRRIQNAIKELGLLLNASRTPMPAEEKR
jgi:protein-tyrosine-phosphatase